MLFFFVGLFFFCLFLFLVVGCLLVGWWGGGGVGWGVGEWVLRGGGGGVEGEMSCHVSHL